MNRRKRVRPGTRIKHASLVDGDGEEISHRILLNAASAPRKAVVCVGGGAGLMDTQDGLNVGSFLAESLGGSSADAAVLAGASMSIDRPNPGDCEACDEFAIHCLEHGFGHIEPKPGVMDVLGKLRELKAPAKTVGVIPTIGDDGYQSRGYYVVEDDLEKDHYAVVDERVPLAILIQFSVDNPGLTWWDERLVVIKYAELLRNESNYRSLHLIYNGGDTTEQECRHVAGLPYDPDNPWNLLLVEDSGRAATKLAFDREFREKYPHPHVQSCTKRDLASKLYEMGFRPALTPEEMA